MFQAITDMANIFQGTLLKCISYIDLWHVHHHFSVIRARLGMPLNPSSLPRVSENSWADKPHYPSEPAASINRPTHLLYRLSEGSANSRLSIRYGGGWIALKSDTKKTTRANKSELSGRSCGMERKWNRQVVPLGHSLHFLTKPTA